MIPGWDGSRQVYAVEELASGGYIIAIKEIIDDQWSNGERTSWQTIQTSATGVLIGIILVTQMI